MAEIQYRHYLPGDEADIINLWFKCMPEDSITSNRFRNLVLLDANFDPEGLRLAFVDSQLIGAAYFVRRRLPMQGTDLEPENGWLVFYFVDSIFQRKGIGTQMLAEGIDFLKQHGRKTLFFASYAPNYILPGIDEKAYPAGYQFLLNTGFERLYSPVAMNVSLNGFQISEEVSELKQKREAEGYTFESVQDGELYHTIQFASNIFNPDWGRAIREGILQGLPTDRILVAKKKGTIVGFCLYGGYEGVLERFGPFGVDPDLRGKGLGKILLHQCMAKMRAEGLHGAWFLWTGEQSPAGKLYKQSGFQITRKFHVMRKQL